MVEYFIEGRTSRISDGLVDRTRKLGRVILYPGCSTTDANDHTLSVNAFTERGVTTPDLSKVEHHVLSDGLLTDGRVILYPERSATNDSVAKLYRRNTSGRCYVTSDVSIDRRTAQIFPSGERLAMI